MKVLKLMDNYYILDSRRLFKLCASNDILILLEKLKTENSQKIEHEDYSIEITDNGEIFIQYNSSVISYSFTKDDLIVAIESVIPR